MAKYDGNTLCYDTDFLPVTARGWVQIMAADIQISINTISCY